MKQLTKAEEEIMQILWGKQEAIIKDVVASFEEKNLHTIPLLPFLRYLNQKVL